MEKINITGKMREEMPRKTRKKSILDRKPPLHFTESPVNKQSHVPSPVLGAINPLSAECRHIDEFTNVSWISPQFGRCGEHDKQQGRRNCKKCSLRNKKAHLSLRDQENISVHHGRRNKFKPLKFLGEITNPVSQVEDVHVTFDTDDEENDPQNVSQKIIQRDAKAIRKKPGNNEEDIQEFETFLQKNFKEMNKNNTSFTRLKTCPISRELTHLPGNEVSGGNECSFIEVDIQQGLASDSVTLESAKLFTHISEKQRHRSPRINRQYIDSVNYLKASTPPRQTPSNCRVIVYDTPESEYGLSVKARQRMRHKCHMPT